MARKPRDPKPPINISQLRLTQVFPALPGGTASLMFPARNKPYRVIAATLRYSATNADVQPTLDVTDANANNIFARFAVSPPLAVAAVFVCWAACSPPAFDTANIGFNYFGPIPLDLIIIPEQRLRMTFNGTVDPLDVIDLITLTSSEWLHP